jgi:hypothetical protein
LFDSLQDYFISEKRKEKNEKKIRNSRNASKLELFSNSILSVYILSYTDE